jgi:hypothetical protein
MNSQGFGEPEFMLPFGRTQEYALKVRPIFIGEFMIQVLFNELIFDQVDLLEKIVVGHETRFDPLPFLFRNGG